MNNGILLEEVKVLESLALWDKIIELKFKSRTMIVPVCKKIQKNFRKCSNNHAPISYKVEEGCRANDSNRRYDVCNGRTF